MRSISQVFATNLIDCAYNFTLTVSVAACSHRGSEIDAIRTLRELFLAHAAVVS
jgi:hypothetical protein